MRSYLLFALVAAGCGSAAGTNPPELFLGLNGSETQVQLVPARPAPY